MTCCDATVTPFATISRILGKPRAVQYASRNSVLLNTRTTSVFPGWTAWVRIPSPAPGFQSLRNTPENPSLLRLLFFLFSPLFRLFEPFTFAIVWKRFGTFRRSGIGYCTLLGSKRRMAAKRSSKLLIAYSLTFTVFTVAGFIMMALGCQSVQTADNQAYRNRSAVGRFTERRRTPSGWRGARISSCSAVRWRKKAQKAAANATKGGRTSGSREERQPPIYQQLLGLREPQSRRAGWLLTTSRPTWRIYTCRWRSGWGSRSTNLRLAIARWRSSRGNSRAKNLCDCRLARSPGFSETTGPQQPS